MGLWSRFKVVFASKANKALNKAEDPREVLDYSYEKQLELLQKVRRGVADVATSRKRTQRVHHRRGALQQRAPGLKHRNLEHTLGGLRLDGRFHAVISGLAQVVSVEKERGQ